MTTQCIESSFQFQPLGSRDVVAQFDGGDITSDAGGLLLRKVEQRTGIVRQFAACFQDRRKPELIEHTVKELVAQRVYGLALGGSWWPGTELVRLLPLKTRNLLFFRLTRSSRSARSAYLWHKSSTNSCMPLAAPLSGK